MEIVTTRMFSACFSTDKQQYSMSYGIRTSTAGRSARVSGEFATTIRSALRRSAPPSVVSAVSFLDQPIDDRERRAKVKAQAQASEAAREAKANRKADEIKRLAEEPRTADEATHTTELKRKSGEECRLTVEPREATKVMLPADDREGSRSTSGKRRRLPVLALVAAGTVALSVAGYITFTPSKVTVAPARRPTIIRRPPEVVSAPEVSVTPAPPLTPPAAPVTKPPDVPLERMPEKIIRDCDQGCPRMVLIPERGVFHGNPSG